MIIDFHTHAFDDVIAARAIEKTEASIMMSDYPFKARAITDGTTSGLLEKMDEWNIDRAVVLPIATKSKQQRVINDWASKFIHNRNTDRLVFFGTVYPSSADAFDELDRIKGLGFRGIKLHPDYQNFYVDDERIFDIYRKCAELGLAVVFHAGYDVLSPDDIHCTPERCARVNDAVPEMTMILAHLGGNEMWDDVERLLVGREIFFDTSFAADHIDDVQAKRLISAHGTDKILFASDCPWQSAQVNFRFIKRLGFDKEDEDRIFYKNALKLLNI